MSQEWEFPELELVFRHYRELNLMRRPYEGAPPPYSEPPPGLSEPRHGFIAPFPPPRYSENSELPQPTSGIQPVGPPENIPEVLASIREACRACVMPNVDTPWTDPELAMVDLFQIKCPFHLLDDCPFPDCDHTFRSAEGVVPKLMAMNELNLLTTYTLITKSRPLFEAFFPAYVRVFDTRGLSNRLLQMMADCRLYGFRGVASIGPIFTALKSIQMEKDATQAMMKNLWVPAEAHTLKAETILVLEVLASSNWHEYVVELVMLTKRYGFTIPTKIFKTILFSTVGRQQLKRAAVPLLAIIPSHVAQRPDLFAIVRRIETFNKSPYMNMIAMAKRMSISRQQS
ncbi:protein deadlock-like [Drosophila obscura]|uniref:protein deadlock-like n=1 Tax=Drosophila obscura TaxID=7282 RepID=UPI001BB1613E|nr:protein deadlock-like [Drosophila obscura]